MRLAVILIILFGFADVAPAQDRDTTTTRVRIEDAENLSTSVVDGEQVNSMLAPRLRQGETVLRARRATQYESRGEIVFVGSVEIYERGDSLRADTVFYNNRSKIARARGNVWLTDGEVVVLAPSARYDTRAKHAVFDDGVTLVDSSTTLRSLTGEYWSDERRAEFAGEVHLDEEQSTLVADSITYFRDDEISIARGNVAIVHHENEEGVDGPARTILFGDYAHNANREQVSRMAGNPLLVQVTADSLGAARDTLIIRSHELEAVRSDTLRRLTATGAVRVWQARMSAVGDSLVYDQWQSESDQEDQREEARMFGGPSAWMDEMQLNGDTIRIAGRDGGVDTLFVTSRSFVAQFDSTLERIHQIKGRDLTALFTDDTLRTMRTGPNAEAIYFLKDDDDNAVRGGVRGSGDEIFFRFRGGELHRVSILSGTQGEYTPADQIPEPYQLEGFRWNPELKPQKADLMGAVDLNLPFDSRSGNSPTPVAVQEREPPLPEAPSSEILDGSDQDI